MMKVIRTGNIVKLTACGQDILVAEVHDAVNIAVTILQCVGAHSANMVEEGKWEINGDKDKGKQNVDYPTNHNRIKRFLGEN